MNIFYLDTDPIVAARSMIDRHVNKMITESSQILGNAIQVNGYKLAYEKEVHSLTKHHQKHPSVLSAATSREVCLWLVYHSLELCAMFGKKHASEDKIHRCAELLGCVPSKSFDDAFRPACGVYNDEYTPPEIIYRVFYLHDKVSFASWGKYGNIRPDWFCKRYFKFDDAWKLQEKRNRTLKRPITKEMFESKVAELELI